MTHFAAEREVLIADKGTAALNERLGVLAHELRNLIHTATLAVTAIKRGNVGLAGATGAVLIAAWSACATSSTARSPTCA